MAFERELPLIQRGIIDNCFEEGHYEYGIDVLDKLRSHLYKPAPLHIRQLLYLSLYPPPPKLSKTADRSNGPSSPQRLLLQQRQKEDVWPKPTSRPLAIALLHAFVATNSPTCLMRGLPYHLYINAEGIKDVDPFKDEDMSRNGHEDHSPLHTELEIFDSLRDIFGILQEGFIKRNQHRPFQQVELEKEMSSNVIGQSAWPILEWAIRVFEKDQKLTAKESSVQYSPLLLVQIPAPKSRSGPRWDTGVVAQIIRACFVEVNSEDITDKYASFEKRCDLGMRLLTLLVNLTFTSPPLLSPSYFLRSLSSHLLEMPLASLRAFLCRVPAHQARFKISLLENYLSSSTSTGSKPGPEAMPRARPKPTTKATFEESTGKRIGKDRQAHVYSPISREALLSLLSSHLSCTILSSNRTAVAIGKYHLLSALHNFAVVNQLGGWETILYDDTLHRCTLDGYMLPTDATEEEIREIESYGAAASDLLRTWELTLKNV